MEVPRRVQSSSTLGVKHQIAAAGEGGVSSGVKKAVKSHLKPGCGDVRATPTKVTGSPTTCHFPTISCRWCDPPPPPGGNFSLRLPFLDSPNPCPHTTLSSVLHKLFPALSQAAHYGGSGGAVYHFLASFADSFFPKLFSKYHHHLVATA